jgi:anti-sigma factor RsiW
MMARGTEHEMTRLLHGELPPDAARELRERILREPALAAAWQRLEGTWNGLSLPPAAPVPPGFSGRVMAQARSQSASGGLSWRSAPGWVRAAAAAALVAGAAAGLGVGGSWPAAEEPADAAAASSLGGP